MFNNFYHDQLAADTIEYRPITDASIRDFYDKIDTIGLNEVILMDDIDEAVELFHDKLLGLYYDCFPIRVKTISFKDRLKPWICGSLKLDMSKKGNYVDFKNRTLYLNNNGLYLGTWLPTN